MSRNSKTSKENRINYVYYGADGSKTVLVPGQDGVTEATIETLHQLDDEEFNSNRAETRRHQSINELNDKTEMILDPNSDVEFEVLEELESKATREIVQGILLELKPQQRDLIYKLYLSDNPLSQSEYAKELGIAETSVSQKAWRARTRIKKTIEDKSIF